MTFVGRYGASARDDLARSCDELIDRAATIDELDPAEHALDAITASVRSFGRSPFIRLAAAPAPRLGCPSRIPRRPRKAGADAVLRELRVPFGNTGDVALLKWRMHPR